MVVTSTQLGSCLIMSNIPKLDDDLPFATCNLKMRKFNTCPVAKVE
jgi:hypothetical protein